MSPAPASSVAPSTTSTTVASTTATTATTAAPISSWAQLVGVEYSGKRPLPPGASDWGGGLLSDIEARALYAYGIAMQDGTLAIFLEVKIEENPPSTAYPPPIIWRIIDVTTIDGIGADGEPWLLSDQCYVNDQIDHFIQGVLLSPTTKERQGPTYAWRFNTETQQIESVAFTDVTCFVPAP